MICLHALRYALVKKDQQRWALLSNLISPQYHHDLYCAYPTDGFVRCIRDRGPKKHYSFHLQNLILENKYSPTMYSVHKIWVELVQQLMSDAYNNALSRCLDISLQSTYINISFYRFDKGDWVAPHIDNEDKIVTQIFYFNPIWSNIWGGCFKLLASHRMEDEQFSVPPLVNFSVAIARSLEAWHCVNPVAEIAKTSRLSLQLEFIKKQG